MAVGAMTCARDRGLRVPDDIAVAGFDDIAMLQDVTPGLTTVHIDLVRVGVVATRLTLESTARQPRIETITGTVVTHDSTPGRFRSSLRPAGHLNSQ